MTEGEEEEWTIYAAVLTADFSLREGGYNNLRMRSPAWPERPQQPAAT